MELLVTLAPILILVLVMYFLMIRPAQKRQKQVQEMQASLQKGDEVVTIGGLHGTVESFDQKHMFLRTDETVIVKFDRIALKEVVK